MNPSFAAESSPLPIALGVNIDHIATLRNVRGTIYPDPVLAAKLVCEAGADAVTLHLREDRRHIRDEDVVQIKALLNSKRTRMNLECAVTSEMLALACQTQADDICLVPEKRKELTTEGGLNVIQNFEPIKDACQQLHAVGSRVSLFIDADCNQIDAAMAAGARIIEIHTGSYADAADEQEEQKELERVIKAAKHACQLGMQINAGHGLHYNNVFKIAALTEITELNIGHAIISHALFVGFVQAVKEMQAIMLMARQKQYSQLGQVIDLSFVHSWQPSYMNTSYRQNSSET